jgi:hypothetical protein
MWVKSKINEVNNFTFSKSSSAKLNFWTDGAAISQIEFGQIAFGQLLFSQMTVGQLSFRSNGVHLKKGELIFGIMN